MDKAAYLDFVIQIIRRSDEQKGFEVLPRRWVVERTFGWMTRWRRLVRDYEARIDVLEAMILVAMGGNMLRRPPPIREFPERTLRPRDRWPVPVSVLSLAEGRSASLFGRQCPAAASVDRVPRWPSRVASEVVPFVPPALVGFPAPAMKSQASTRWDSPSRSCSLLICSR